MWGGCWWWDSWQAWWRKGSRRRVVLPEPHACILFVFASFSQGLIRGRKRITLTGRGLWGGGDQSFLLKLKALSFTNVKVFSVTTSRGMGPFKRIGFLTRHFSVDGINICSGKPQGLFTLRCQQRFPVTHNFLENKQKVPYLCWKKKKKPRVNIPLRQHVTT